MNLIVSAPLRDGVGPGVYINRLAASYSTSDPSRHPFWMYSQPHLIGTWLIGSSGSDQDFTPDNHCYDRQVASLSVITMAYQVRNLDHFLNSRLTRFRLSGVDCIRITFLDPLGGVNFKLHTVDFT